MTLTPDAAEPAARVGRDDAEQVHDGRVDAQRFFWDGRFSGRNEETFFWYDGVNRILAGKWTIDCFYMNEPVNISAFWSFFKYRVNNIRIDISPAVRYRQINKIGCFFRDTLILLEVFQHRFVMT